MSSYLPILHCLFPDSATESAVHFSIIKVQPPLSRRLWSKAREPRGSWAFFPSTTRKEKAIRSDGQSSIVTDTCTSSESRRRAERRRQNRVLCFYGLRVQSFLFCTRLLTPVRASAPRPGGSVPHWMSSERIFRFVGLFFRFMSCLSANVKFGFVVLPPERDLSGIWRCLLP